MAAVGVASLILTPLVAVTPAVAAPDGSDVVINELYARGGSANAPYTNKFVELFNPTDAPVSLDGMTLQYRSAASTGATTDSVELSGSIPAGGYFLVQGNSNGETGGALPTPDIVTSFNPGGTNGVVALVDGTARVTLPQGSIATGALDGAVVDLIGTGTATTFETAPAVNEGSNGTPLSWQRAGAVDTDDNSADFTMSAPTPQNSGGTGTDPGEEPDPEPEPEPGEVTPIAEIQGTGEATPLSGQTVTTRGLVTAAYPTGNFNGVYIQTPGTGGDLEGHTASHGIFVYGADMARAVEIGDHVEVTGRAGEYNGLTQLTNPTWTVLDEPAEAVKAAAVAFPATNVERERYEGMLIEPQGEYVVTDTYSTNRYGSIGLAAGDELLRQPTDVGRPGSDEAAAAVADRAARAVTLDDGSSWDYTTFSNGNHAQPIPYLSTTNPVRVGAEVTFTEPVILDYRFQWNFQPTSQVTGTNEASPATFENTRTAAPEDVGGDTTIASFNVLNYFTTLGTDAGCSTNNSYRDREGNPITTNNCEPRGAYNAENFARQEAKIVAAITALGADVVALEEIENSRHFTDDENRDEALSRLVEALNEEAGAGTWAYVASPEDVPADEDVIRNAFIYQPAAVAPVGESVILDDPAFANAREPLAQEFAPVDDEGEVIEDAETFIAITNHFKSKGSGSGQDADTGDGQGASNYSRVRQAEALAAFADELVEDLGTENVFLLGDFNSYTQEDPMHELYGAGYTNIGQKTGKSTYLFDGVVGSLDHILGNEAAEQLVTGADIWNINAYESIALEYSRYNYNVTKLYDESPYRSSDHDPILVGLDLVADEPEPTTVDINLLAFNDFHGRLNNYATNRNTGVVTNDTLSFAGTIEELRAEAGEENTLLFSSGDNIGASLFTSSVQEDEPTIDVLNALDVATSNVGNHEFDAGFDNLTGQVSDWAEFEHLGANVYGEDGEPALPEYATFEVDGVSVAVIGVVTQQTPSLVRPAGIEGLTFGNPVEAVNRVAAELSDEVDVIVASFHEGAPAGAGSTLEEQVESSEVFAEIVNDTSAEVDAIFNGHTHEVYAWDAPVPGGGDGALRPVIQGESYGEYISQVVLTVDLESRDVVDYSQRNVPTTATPWQELVETFPRVEAVQEILDAALEEAEEIGSVPVGSVTADITTAHKLNDAGVPGRDDRTSESTLGNLVANALRDQLNEERLGAAEIGVVNPGGLRAELLLGDDGVITFAEANAVLPFVNNLWTVTLTGEQFVTMLEQQWQPSGAGNPFLHLGLSDNVSYTIDPEAESGERITSVTVDGAPIDPEAEYRIGTFSFLAEGGDNFSVFREATDVQDTGLVDRDAWIEYLEENSPLSPDFARRSTIVTPLPSELVAGEEVSFEVSRLDLTSLGSPDNTELDVYLVGEDGERGEAVHTATVTDGAATVTFTVPAELDGEYTLEMEAAPSGTTIQLPVTVEGVELPPAQEYGFFLSNDWSGVAHYAFQYGRSTDEVLIGDWDGNGTDTITVRRGKQYFVNNAPQGGPATSVFSYGRAEDIVLAGDWDGDGVDTLAVRRGKQYFVKNSLRGGEADQVITYGRADDAVLVGDWDGNGTDTFAVRRGATYHVKNRIAGGDADVTFTYGRADDATLAGDWDGNGTDTFAIRRDREFHVKNSLRGGPADFTMIYGRSGDDVYVGDWNGDGKDTLGVRRTPAS